MLERLKYFILLVGFYSCEKGPVGLNNNDLLFPNSVHLNIPMYSFNDSLDNIFKVQGDSIYYTGIPDSLNNEPLLKWDSIDLNIITVAIFKAKPAVVGSTIKNPGDIIWQWHSGMNLKETRGQVKYSEGRNVINDSIEYYREVLPLSKGNYFWAVWSWSDDGTAILFSSRVMSFYVPN
jgi:hypothetical protein